MLDLLVNNPPFRKVRGALLPVPYILTKLQERALLLRFHG